MDQDFSIIWENNLQGFTYHDGIALSGSEEFLAHSLYQLGSCPIAKYNTEDGSISFSKLITGAQLCESVSISGDDTEVYVSGDVTLSPRIFKIDASTFTVSSVTSVGVTQVNSIYTYINGGFNMLLINAYSSAIIANYNIIALNTTSQSMDWSKTVTCGLT